MSISLAYIPLLHFTLENASFQLVDLHGLVDGGQRVAASQQHRSALDFLAQAGGQLVHQLGRYRNLGEIFKNASLAQWKRFPSIK
jgi:hypothetical protein